MLSNSKCPSCSKSSFETSSETVDNYNFKITFIRCSHCKTVIGVLEHLNIGNLMVKIANHLKIPL